MAASSGGGGFFGPPISPPVPTNTATIIQYAEDELTQIQWNTASLEMLASPNNVVGITTMQPLIHFARSPKYDLTNVTWFIKYTGFNFINVPDTISGITATIEMNRGGRAADDTIQLVYNGDMIGENQAKPAVIHNAIRDISALENKAIYGGPSNTWGVSDITPDMVNDPSFGIVIRYKSHPAWPHKTYPLLYSVQLQIN
jgi:hypothetical protein